MNLMKQFYSTGTLSPKAIANEVYAPIALEVKNWY